MELPGKLVELVEETCLASLAVSDERSLVMGGVLLINGGVSDLAFIGVDVFIVLDTSREGGREDDLR